MGCRSRHRQLASVKSSTSGGWNSTARTRAADRRVLGALADVQETDAKPVRLVRRVAGGSFEFVHDQMHAYLAARWFSQEGFSVAELEKMLEASTIWTQAPEARQTLWSFVAALLDDQRLIGLWTRIEDKEDWDSLRRALKAEAGRRGLTQEITYVHPSEVKLTDSSRTSGVPSLSS